MAFSINDAARYVNGLGILDTLTSRMDGIDRSLFPMIMNYTLADGYGEISVLDCVNDTDYLSGKKITTDTVVTYININDEWHCYDQEYLLEYISYYEEPYYDGDIEVHGVNENLPVGCCHCIVLNPKLADLLTTNKYVYINSSEYYARYIMSTDKYVNCEGFLFIHFRHGIPARSLVKTRRDVMPSFRIENYIVVHHASKDDDNESSFEITNPGGTLIKKTARNEAIRRIAAFYGLNYRVQKKHRGDCIVHVNTNDLGYNFYKDDNGQWI